MLPQIIGNIVPVYMSMFVMCMQITSVASVIGVKEFLSTTDSVSSAVLGIVLSIVGYFLIGTLGDFAITRMGKRKHIKAGDVLEKTEVR
jgi:ABC-type amino acid transport system permease subunit